MKTQHMCTSLHQLQLMPFGKNSWQILYETLTLKYCVFSGYTVTVSMGIIHPPIYPYIGCPSIHPSVHTLAVLPSIHPSIHPSICPFIGCLSTHPFFPIPSSQYFTDSFSTSNKSSCMFPLTL